MKDHYLVLGIPRSESPQGVRRAFHDLVREHHPDLAGPEATPMFRDVVEAYRVLSDPERRRRYDARLGGASSLDRGAPVRVRRRRGASFAPVDLIPRERSVRPSTGDLLERLFRNFTGHPLGKGEGPEPLLCDVALDASEARRGGSLPVRIPVLAPCPLCHGGGTLSGRACRACDGLGRTPTELVVPIGIPPGVRSGTTLDVGLERWGVRNLWLRVRIRVT